MKKYREVNNESLIHDKSLIYYYVKIWGLGILIITLLYLICVYYEYGFFVPSFCDENKKKFLKTITPAYPPPLVNFM